MVLKCYAGDMSGVVSGRGATLGVCQGQYQGATLGVCQGQYQGAMLGVCQGGIRPGCHIGGVSKAVPGCYARTWPHWCQDAMLEACWGATISIFTGEHHYRVPLCHCLIPAIITGCPSVTVQYWPSLQGAPQSLFNTDHHYRVPLSHCSIPTIITGCPSVTIFS